MKVTALLTLLFLLTSCGGGSRASNTTIALDPDKIHIKIVKSTGSYSVDGPALEGVVVQLDYDGENRISDKDGIVTFSVNDFLEHDIHVFGQNGYNWRSIYNAKRGVLNKFQLSHRDDVTKPTTASYLSFKLNIPNIAANSSYEFYFYDTENKQRYKENDFIQHIRSGNNIDVDFSIDMPVGKSITGELIVMEYQQDANEKILIDSAIMPKNTYLTKNFQDTTFNSQTIDLLKLNKLAQTTAMTFNSIKVPTGLASVNLRLYRASSTNDLRLKLAPTLFVTDQIQTAERTISAYSSFDYEYVSYHISGIIKLPLTKNNANILWQKSGFSARYSVINFIPKITVFPDFQENQPGDTLSWNFADNNLTRQQLTIQEVQTTSGQKISWWGILLSPNATMVRLPKIPAGITPLLTVNTEYSVTINGIADLPNGYESFDITGLKWVR